MVTADKFLNILKDCMSDGQLKFFEAYVRNGQNGSATAEELGIVDSGVVKYKAIPVVRHALEIYNDPDLEEHSEVSLEWLRNEMKNRYDNAPPEDKSKWFDKIMKFQEKFGEMVGEDDLQIRSMDNSKLIEFMEECLKVMGEFVKKNSWKDAL